MVFVWGVKETSMTQTSLSTLNKARKIKMTRPSWLVLPPGHLLSSRRWVDRQMEPRVDTKRTPKKPPGGALTGYEPKNIFEV
jgi:hypothetical protein